MPAITFDRFDAGLDVRKGPTTSGANQLREATNVYVTTGKTLRKRAGLEHIATLEPGTVGLVSSGGKLHTFFSGGADVVHANTLFSPHRIDHGTDGTKVVSEILGAENFNGFLYVAAQYADGVMQHHYLDDPGAWVPATAYVLGDVRRPTVQNGYRYTVTVAGTTAASEPAWPTTIGATIVDGTVTWRCDSHDIKDPNCPHSASIIKQASKIFAIDPVGETVPFSATDLPRDWSSANDAGFLPTGLRQSGSRAPTGLGQYLKQLVVFHADSSQVWTVDPDPVNMAFVQVVDGVGTRYPLSIGNVAGDSIFLDDSGMRSITTLAYTNNLADVDIGSPIDKLIRAIVDSFTVLASDGTTIRIPPIVTVSTGIDGVLLDIVNSAGAVIRLSAINPKTVNYSARGQLIVAFDDTAFVYSFSRTAKISAWTEYSFKMPLDVVTQLNGKLYIRSGDDVFRVHEFTTQDDGLDVAARIVMPFLDMKSPGVMKQFVGMDIALEGSCKVSFMHDPDDLTQVTDPIVLSGDTKRGDTIPVELMSTAIAPIFESVGGEPMDINSITLYFENLGVV